MPDPLPRLAYLTNWYPAVSLTFVLREIEALRAEGAEVLPALIRLTVVGDGADCSALEAAAAPLDERMRFTG